MKIIKKITITLSLIFSFQSFSSPLCIDEFNRLDKILKTEIQKSAIENSIDMDLVFASGKAHPESKIGCYLPNAKAYEVLRPLIKNVAEKYHRIKIYKDHKSDLEEGSATKVDLDPEGRYILSSRVRVARNLASYPFPSSISKKERKVLEKKMFSAFKSLPDELKGVYKSLELMRETEKQELISSHLLFETSDKFLESAKIHRDMPSGRGIFLSSDKQFMIWVNEEDHLRIMSLRKGPDLAGAFRSVSKALKILDQKLVFAFDKQFGHLTSCPTNIGTSMRASFHIKLPTLSKKSNFKEICSNLGLQIRGANGESGQSDGDVLDISNLQRLGKSEKELIDHLILGVHKLITMEKAS